VNRISNIPVEKLRERARVPIEESERIIERARQIEAETRALVNNDHERISLKGGAANLRTIQPRSHYSADSSD
jgi:hypothetical protein